MQKIEIFCNYGVLTAEKRNVYTCGGQHEQATCSDKLTVSVPDDWKLYENAAGTTMVRAPWGECYEINEILQGNLQPCFYALDGEMKGHRVFLDAVEE